MADAGDLALALELAELTSNHALAMFKRGVTARRKPDGSSVSDADLSVDALLQEALEQARPDDAVLSEESGERGSGTRRWILDPIDGTSWFINRRSTWGTHIALEEDGEVVLGVITRPVTGLVWWSLRGAGAWRGGIGAPESGQRLQVSDVDERSAARVMVWAGNSHPLELVVRNQLRGVEPSLDGPMLLAEGAIDLLIDDIGCAWDVAPRVPIIEEAGGAFFDRRGGRDIHLGGGIFTNGRLEELVSVLGSYAL